MPVALRRSDHQLHPKAGGICIQKQEASDAEMLAMQGCRDASDAEMLANPGYSQPRTMKPTIAPIRRLAGTAMASEIAIANVELDLAVGSTDQSSGN